MLRIAIFFMALLAALALAVDAPIPGYAVVPLTWEVQAFDNGTMVNLSGTIEQVADQLSKINPDYPRNTTANTTLQLGVAGQAGFDPHCGTQGWNWDPAPATAIYDGIQYLDGVSGRPSLGPGPGTCGRVSCSWGGAIWWCNDHDATWTMFSFAEIATCAGGIYNKCTYEASPGNYLILGQNFHTDQWNCIVRFDYDNC